MYPTIKNPSYSYQSILWVQIYPTVTNLFYSLKCILQVGLQIYSTGTRTFESLLASPEQPTGMLRFGYPIRNIVASRSFKIVVQPNNVVQLFFLQSVMDPTAQMIPSAKAKVSYLVLLTRYVVNCHNKRASVPKCTFNSSIARA